MIWYLLSIISAFLASIGQVSLKHYGVKNKRDGGLMGLYDYHFIISVIFFCGSFGLGVLIMRHLDFSVYYAFTSLNYLFINYLSYRFLGEKIDMNKHLGIAIIVLGLVVFNL